MDANLPQLAAKVNGMPGPAWRRRGAASATAGSPRPDERVGGRLRYPYLSTNRE